MQTENPTTKDSTMQTKSTLRSTVEIQTDQPDVATLKEQEVQVNTFAVEMSTTQC